MATPKFMAQINTPQPVRGMQSLLGEEADRFHAVVAAFDRVRRLFGFRRVEVPVLEPTAVFARSLGETTDVVSKEMYTFEDRSGDSVTLRPEFTAGVVFRGERPIKPGNSWFSAKTIEVVPRMFSCGGRALDGLGGREVYQT